jgi:tetratricopeptide (TPR) repeat protein
LVVGDDPQSDHGELSKVRSRAEQLRSLGYSITILRENEFLDRMNLSGAAPETGGLHSATELATLLHVRGCQLRRWMKMGLLRPVMWPSRSATVAERLHHKRPLQRLASPSSRRVDSDDEGIRGLPYFDFREVAMARRLVELNQKGVSAAKVQRGLARIAEFLPPQVDPWSQVARLEGDGRALARVNNVLLDDRGQQYFDFDAQGADSIAAISTEKVKNADTCFSAALAFEDAGELQAAADEYARAIAIEPDNSVLYFNLANVYFAAQDFRQAATLYRSGIVRDANYVEAWNNLGGALIQLGEWTEAKRVLQRAIELNPAYADAHFNLAMVLDELGNPAEAERHRQLHRQYGSLNRFPAGREPLLRLYRST